jgi:hypothetical protein
MGTSQPYCCFTRERQTLRTSQHERQTKILWFCRQWGHHNLTVASHVRDRRLELVNVRDRRLKLVKMEPVPIRMLHSKDLGGTPALRSQGIERWRANSPLRVLPLRLSAVAYSKWYSKVLEYEYRVKTAALDTLKRYSILSLTLYLEQYSIYSIVRSGGPY